MKVCYYDVLKIENTATPDDIKKAYRKLALIWHPDKNVGRETEAHLQFQCIQEAYNVLSDHHERAWYDKHRDQILNSDSNASECFNIFPYFTVSCYKGYGDEEDGFYAVYRKVFAEIAAEDEAAVGRGKHKAPTFGTSQCSYEDVVEAFYSFWSNYSTRRSFAWADEKISREYGRRVVRAIEKENSKKREKLKKERNEEIRNLVSFVRKRDKRIIAWSTKMAQEKEEKSRRAEELRQEQVLKNIQMKEGYKETDWTKFSKLNADLADIERNLDETFAEARSSSSEVDSDDETFEPKSFFCAACHKLFQSEKAFINHEGSKKHKQNVALMEKSED